MSGKTSKKICSECGQSFLRLGAHRCKGDESKATQGQEKQKEKCSTCGDSFVRLGAHRCKADESKGKQAQEKRVKHSSTGQQPMLKGIKDKSKAEFVTKAKHVLSQKCPTCGKTFQKLSMHKCKSAGGYEGSSLQQTEGESGVDNNSLLDDEYEEDGDDEDSTESSVSSSISRDDKKKECPTCHRLFKRLGMHKCKGIGRGINSLGDSSPNSRQLSDQDKTNAQEQCLKSLKFFKRLGMHKCKESGEPLICSESHETVEEKLADVKVEPSAEEIFERVKKCGDCGELISPEEVHKCPEKRDDCEGLGKMKTCSNDPWAEFKKLEKKFKLKREDTKPAAKFINDLMGQLSSNLNRLESKFEFHVMKSGSYYEKLKVSQADEFDIMLTTELPILTPSLNGKCSTFCPIEILENERQKYQEYLTEGRWLSPKAVKEYLEREIPGCISNMKTRNGHNIKMVDECKSPSVAMRFTVPRYYNGKLEEKEYDVDLVPAVTLHEWPSELKLNARWVDRDKLEKIRKTGIHVVPKPPESERDVPTRKYKLWRLSFSAAEKELLFHADAGQKTCRKRVIRALKMLLQMAKEQNPSIQDICSYHIKTHMLHQFDNVPDSDDWLDKCERHRLKKSMEALIDALDKRYLEHYFIPGENLFSPVPKEQVDRFKSFLENMSQRY